MPALPGISARVVAALIVAASSEASAPAQAPPKPPSAGKAKELVTQWFATDGADAAGRAKIESALAPIDVLPPADVKKWMPILLELARKGRKLESGGTHYFLDEKEKRGKYIVQGDKKCKQLVICLHGGGEGAGDAGSAFSGFGAALGGLKSTLAVYPEVLRKTEKGWTEDDTERFVLELIEAAKRTHPIDTNRIYLTGHSMGGFGTWTLGSRHADLFGGLAAFAGAPTPYWDPSDSTNTKVVGIEDGVLPNLYDLPIFVYQSGDDRNVPAPVNDFAAGELKKLTESVGGAGWKHVYERVEGRGHGFPDGGPQRGIEWALGHVRDARPKKIVWQPSRTWKKSFYWLRCEEPPIGKTITAEVTGPNAIAITTSAGTKSKGLALFVDERLVDLAQDMTVTVDGEKRFAGRPELRLTTMLRTLEERLDPDYVFAARVDL